MTVNLSRRAVRWAIIASAALSPPWFVSRSKSASVSSVKGAQLPAFRIGEILNYRIDWQRYAGAAVAQLQVVDRGNFYGSQSWHFRASVHTAEPIRALYPMDDQIDSYALLAGLESRQYQEHFREFGKPEDTDLALVSPGEASNGPLPRVIVPLGTHDAVSAIYSLREVDWLRTPEFRIPVFDGQNVYEMVAKPNTPMGIHVAAGDYKATEIEIRLLEGNQEIPDEHFKIWLADDAARTPLLCEADLSIGTLRIELTSDAAFRAEGAGNPVTPGARSNRPAGN
jgi:Protein of unknown function (DUF3108)